jgi:hypothetical protein
MNIADRSMAANRTKRLFVPVNEFDRTGFPLRVRVMLRASPKTQKNFYHLRRSLFKTNRQTK